MAILEVQCLEKIYTTRFGGNQVRALTNVSFSVEHGEYVAIMGESGSGKTTLLNILAALDKPTKGDIFLEGKPLSLIKEKELSIHSYLIVQKPYMERRAYAAFKAILPTEECSVTSPNISFEEYFKEYEEQNGSTQELLNVMVGDLQRMKVYPKKGWQIEQVIPDYVWSAYEELVFMGYDKYVIKEGLQ